MKQIGYMCPDWESNPQPLVCSLVLSPLGHTTQGVDTFESLYLELTGHTCVPLPGSVPYFFFLLLFILFLDRGEGREKERERNINVWLSLACPLLGTQPTTQACQPGQPLPWYYNLKIIYLRTKKKSS